ncbi:MAG: MFS transporter [Acidobacteria bacterium]|nr:MFS transporter [Acidobacteriota bacterium]
MLLVAAAAMVGTLPGRTQGLGLITEPLLLDLGLSRVTYAQLNFWATIIGAGGAIGIGRAIDHFGSRVVLSLVALALGAVVVVMSRAQGTLDMALWLTLTRALGQSALSVVALAIVGHWFVRRIDKAMAVFSVVMSVGFMLAFPAVGWLVQTRGWRSAWLSIGLSLLIVLAPLAWLIVRRSPESCGLDPDGAPSETSHPRSGHRWQAALRTPAFWLFAIGTALYGLVASGIGLFNESILAERGFGPEVYYQTLVVTAITALAGNGLGGWLAGRVPLLTLLSLALGVLAAGVLALPFVTALAHVMVWAVAMGLGGGLIMVLFFSVWPRVFGRRDLGAIQGAAQALTVLASALGPLLLAWCVDWTGSYQSIFYLLSGVIGVVAAASLFVRLPDPAR